MARKMRRLHNGRRCRTYEFTCDGCGDRVTKSSYCIAQQASGHVMHYGCPKCKHTMEVPQ